MAFHDDMLGLEPDDPLRRALGQITGVETSAQPRSTMRSLDQYHGMLVDSLIRSMQPNAYKPIDWESVRRQPPEYASYKTVPRDQSEALQNALIQNTLAEAAERTARAEAIRGETGGETPGQRRMTQSGTKLLEIGRATGDLEMVRQGMALIKNANPELNRLIQERTERGFPPREDATDIATWFKALTDKKEGKPPVDLSTFLRSLSNTSYTPQEIGSIVPQAQSFIPGTTPEAVGSELERISQRPRYPLQRARSLFETPSDPTTWGGIPLLNLTGAEQRFQRNIAPFEAPRQRQQNVTRTFNEMLVDLMRQQAGQQ